MRQDPSLLMMSRRRLSQKKREHDQLQEEVNEVLEWQRRINRSLWDDYIKGDEDEISVIDNVPIHRDGNCFFYCIARSLHKHHGEIRRKCVQYLKKNKQFCKQYGIKMKQIRYLQTNGNWNNDAMDFMPRVASNVFNITLILHTERRHEYYPYPNNSIRDVHISYQNDHYKLISAV